MIQRSFFVVDCFLHKRPVDSFTKKKGSDKDFRYTHDREGTERGGVFQVSEGEGKGSEPFFFFFSFTWRSQSVGRRMNKAEQDKETQRSKHDSRHKHTSDKRDIFFIVNIFWVCNFA